MPDEIDEILKYIPQSSGGQPAARSEADEIAAIADGIGGSYQDTSTIDTRTSKPKTKYIKPSGKPASAATIAKAEYTTKPQDAIPIYAKARGIPTSRYRVFNGEVIYRDEKNQWQRETPDTLGHIVQRGLVRTAANPAVLLGTAGGILGGPPGAGTGAMAGEIIRRGAAVAVNDSSDDFLGTLGGIWGQGLLALTGEAAGKALQGAVYARRLKKSGFRPGAHVVNPGKVTPEEHAKALFMQDLAKQNGIDLPMPQAYDKASIENMWMYLRKHPDTSDTIRGVEEQLGQQTDAAIKSFVKQIGGYKNTSAAVGQKAKDIATGALNSADALRSKWVDPLYKQAFEEADTALDPINIAPAMDKLDTIMQAYNDVPTKKVLERVKKSFIPEKTQVPKPEKMPLLYDASGNPIKTEIAPIPDGPQYETDLRKLQNSIFNLNDLIEGTSKEAAEINPSSKAALNRELSQVKEMLLKQIGDTAPSFIKANAEFSRLSAPIDKLKIGIIGELSRLENDKTMAEASQKLLSAGNIKDAALVKQARDIIEPNDPDAWLELVGDYIGREYGAIKSSGETKDLLAATGKLHTKIFGSEQQREIMQAALPKDLFNQLDGLMTVVKRAQVGTKGQSMTAQFQQMEAGMNTIKGSEAYRLAMFTKAYLAEKGLGWWNDILVSGRHKELLNAMLDPEAIKLLSSVKRMKPGSEKLINGLSAYGALISTKLGVEDIGTPLPEEPMRGPQ
jgi:cell wall assembly regulator SMI1